MSEKLTTYGCGLCPHKGTLCSSCGRNERETAQKGKGNKIMKMKRTEYRITLNAPAKSGTLLISVLGTHSDALVSAKRIYPSLAPYLSI